VSIEDDDDDHFFRKHDEYTRNMREQSLSPMSNQGKQDASSICLISLPLTSYSDLSETVEMKCKSI
jgi:hypothetical protein